jgi:hypothetical protein
LQYNEELQQHILHMMTLAGAPTEVIIGPYFLRMMILQKKFFNVLKPWHIPGLSRDGWINSVMFVLF